MKKSASARRPKKRKAPPKTTRQPVKRSWPISMILVFLLLVVLGSFGWWWKSQVYSHGVHVYGTEFSEPDTLLNAIAIDSSTLFFDIAPQAVAMKVAEDPWVESARVRRLPNAELAVTVTERTPALLLVDNEGNPDRFLDQSGYQMPFRKHAVFDVPLLFGLQEAFHPTEPIQHPAVQSLLKDLQQIPDDVDALISAFTIKPDGELFLHTNPIPGRGSIDARLGQGSYGKKLTRLHAFWHQTVLTKRDYNIEAIDLRFDSQIITNEVRLSQ